MPRISVIIPTYNCAQFLERTLESVFAQTFTDFEVLVIDDGSTDGTKDIIARWDNSVIYMYQRNHGPSSARNLGVSKSNGEFIAYLDADDMWYPRKLERQVAFMDANPECGLVHSDLSMIDENDRVTLPYWYRNREITPSQGLCLIELLRNCQIQVPSVLERRACYERAGGSDERVKGVEDYLHWIRVAMDGQVIGFIDERLAMWRWRGGSLSKNMAAMTEAEIRMFHILVEENGLSRCFGPQVKEVVHYRVATLRRSLPYHYRHQGRSDLARKKAAELIGESPARLYPYVEFMKSYIPISLLRRLRKY